MEKYAELASNGLDLLSFLLVTDVILKAIMPAAATFFQLLFGGFFTIAIWSLFCVYFWLLYVGSRAALHLLNFSGWSLVGLSVLCTLVLHSLLYILVAMVGLAFRQRNYEPDAVPRQRRTVLGHEIIKKIFAFATYASEHLFPVGVLLFFVSRLIAFYGSAVKAGFLADLF
jgi:hypothetical protein